MNHYDRLKVSRDAPPEVIRAAYRALATKLHPDRQGSETGPDCSMHEQMAALNTAYEILIDPKLRQDYDATLEVGLSRAPLQDPQMMRATDVDARPEDGGDHHHRVDMDWLVPKPVTQPSMWPPSRQLSLIGGGLLALLVAVGGGTYWHMQGQQQMERALSDQYAHSADHNLGDGTPDLAAADLAPSSSRDGSPGARSGDAVAAAMPTGDRRPTVDELSRMSDEELMRVLPSLDTSPQSDAARRAVAGGNVVAHATGAAPRRSPAHHPLDGKPLNLRTDTQLIDPLAPEPASGKARP